MMILCRLLLKNDEDKKPEAQVGPKNKELEEVASKSSLNLRYWERQGAPRLKIMDVILLAECPCIEISTFSELFQNTLQSEKEREY